MDKKPNLLAFIQKKKKKRENRVKDREITLITFNKNELLYLNFTFLPAEELQKF